MGWMETWPRSLLGPPWQMSSEMKTSGYELSPPASARVADLAMQLVGKTRLDDVVTTALETLEERCPNTLWAILERVGHCRYRGHATRGLHGEDLRMLAASALGGEVSVVNATGHSTVSRGIPRWAAWLARAQPEVVVGVWAPTVDLPSRQELRLIAQLLSAAFGATGEVELLRRANERDDLTQINNRKAIIEFLALQRAQAERFPSPISVVFVDLNDFKAVNDVHGHAAGDAALCQVARIAAETIRGTDAVGRWGGDEFLLVLPDTDRITAEAVAHRLRENVARQPLILGDTRIPLSISAGVASSEEGPTADLVSIADQRMLAEKRRRMQFTAQGDRGLRAS